MVKQQSLHLKLDNKNYTWLKQYQLRTGVPMNRLINIACQRFVELAQGLQRFEAKGKGDEWIEKAVSIGITSTYGMD